MSATRPPARVLRIEDLAVQPGPPLADGELPRVAVVIVTLNGRALLARCLAELDRSRYPRELRQWIVVDNGSRDGTAEMLRREHPACRILANAANRGFAAASNQGAAAAGDAEVLVFLNNDVLVEPDWLRELVAPIARGECAASASKQLSWDGTRIDFAGGGANFQGIAVPFGYREEPGPEHEIPRRCLFACGGACAVRASTFHSAGGFDEDFFAYLEDLDLGWRLWLLGHEVHYAPGAVCRHYHSRTARTFPPETLRVVQTRNALLCCYKNYARESLDRVFPVLLATAVRRMWVMARLDASSFRMERASPGPPETWRRLVDRFRPRAAGAVPLERLAAADLVALNDLLGNLAHWEDKRERVQSRRTRGEQEILRLFLKPFWCVEGEREYIDLQERLIARHGLDALFESGSIPGPDPHKGLPPVPVSAGIP